MSTNKNKLLKHFYWWKFYRAIGRRSLERVHYYLVFRFRIPLPLIDLHPHLVISFFKKNKMPRPHKNLNENSIVDVNARFLHHTDLSERLGQRYDFDTPLLSFKGRTVSKFINDKGKTIYDVIFDELPGVAVPISGSSMKYIGPGPAATAPDDHEELEDMEIDAALDAALGDDEDDDEDDVLDDAIQDADEVDEVDRPDLDEDENETSENESENDDETDNSDDDGTWVKRGLVTDSRIRSREGYVSMKARINMNNPEISSPLDFFLRFLPVDHIRNLVIPSINDHAHSMVSNWKDLTWLEYMTWMGLMLHMMIWKNDDCMAYWRMADIGSHLSIDFGEYMSYERFKEIIKMHVFKIPDGEE